MATFDEFTQIVVCFFTHPKSFSQKSFEFKYHINTSYDSVTELKLIGIYQIYSFFQKKKFYNSHIYIKVNKKTTVRVSQNECHNYGKICSKLLV